MKKIIFLFLVVIALFVVSCAPGADGELLEDVTADEAAQVVPSGEKGALAGQATKWENCVDSDTAGAWNEKSQLLTKSSTSYTGGSKEDQCYTWYKGTPKEKTRLIEGVCMKRGTMSRFNYWYADCSAFGSEFQCVDGACVEEICGINEVEPYCNGINKITKSINTCTGKATISFTNCDPVCNPSVGQGCGGGGFSTLLGQECSGNSLKINEDEEYDCSQKEGFFNSQTCAPFPAQYDFEEELLEFGKFSCAEPCTPGQIITICEDDEYYSRVCNNNGLGWADKGEVSSCPNGQACAGAGQNGVAICQ